VQWLEPEAEHSPLSSAEATNEWIFATSLPISLMVFKGTTFHLTKRKKERERKREREKKIKKVFVAELCSGPSLSLLALSVASLCHSTNKMYS